MVWCKKIRNAEPVLERYGAVWSTNGASRNIEEHLRAARSTSKQSRAPWSSVEAAQSTSEQYQSRSVVLFCIKIHT